MIRQLPEDGRPFSLSCSLIVYPLPFVPAERQDLYLNEDQLNTSKGLYVLPFSGTRLYNRVPEEEHLSEGRIFVRRHSSRAHNSGNISVYCIVQQVFAGSETAPGILHELSKLI